MRVVFMGTPEFAVSSLKALMQAHEVVAVVTRPDAQKGRGKKVRFSPVKETALEGNIPVLQPERGGLTESLKEYSADVFVVAAYGMILPEAVLGMPKYGCINVHASLLPKLRGAAPIQWAVINGEKTTGVTIMHMDKGLDTGDMILKRELEINAAETGGGLYNKLAALGAEALLEALSLLESGLALREPQNHDEATYAPMLKKEHGLLNWNEPSVKIVDLVRGLDPWPSAYTYYNSGLIKIWKARRIEGYPNGVPGEIMDVLKDGFVVKTGDGAILVTELQGQGTKRMKAADYLRGHTILKGARL